MGGGRCPRSQDKGSWCLQLLGWFGTPVTVARCLPVPQGLAPFQPPREVHITDPFCT